MKHKIFVALSTFAEADRSPLERLEASGVDFALHTTGKRITPAEVLRDAPDATVILAGVEPYDATTLSQLPNLKCLSRCGVGTDAIDHDAAREHGVAIRNTPGIPTRAVAELALTMFLALSRNLLRQNDHMRAHEWKRLPANLLGGRTVGLIGLGQIGAKVAELCLAFDCRVLAHDPNISTAPAGVELTSKERILSEADIVSLHASKSPDQKVLIGADEIAVMKPGTALVNLARGDMVDETALVNALRSGHLTGAGLDVFPEEPYSGPLCDLPQVILTPHCATNTKETRAAMELACVENALAFIAGRE